MLSLLAGGLTISFLWGVMPVAHKYVLEGDVSPYTIMAVGFLPYMLCLLLLFFMKRDLIINDIKKMNSLDVSIITLTAVLCGFCANLIYYHIVKHNKSYLVSALIYSSTLFTLLFGWLFLREKITHGNLVGGLLIVSGVIVLALNN